MLRLRAGNVLAGRYLLLKSLGKGGEGSVWLAVHQKTEQLWAVKEISHVDKEDGMHELNMMKKLNHVCLPKVMDVLEVEGYDYLIMEYIRGKTLENVLHRQGHLPVDQVLEIGIQLSGALCYLHTRPKPVYHLDIKPSNLIWKKNGRLMLVDFGAAWKNAVEDPAEEEANTAEPAAMSGHRGLGTEGYAAPEQYDKSKPVDARTDIYGIGATLYHLVSGVRYSRMMAKSRIPCCPEKLGLVIKRCLAEAPGERYENCRQLQRALQKIRKRQNYQKRRHQMWASLCLAVIVTVLAARELPKEFIRRNGQEWNYEKLLEEARCVSQEEGYDYYQRAALLEPDNPQAYMQMLQQAEQDGCYSKAEEVQIRRLLHTIPLGQERTYEECLAENPEGYGRFAGQMGMMYWYEYEGDEGRSIAAGWFAKAEQGIRRAGMEADAKDWVLQTEVFARISDYYEWLGQRDRTGEKEDTAGKYWNDLTDIYKRNLEEKMTPVMKLRFWEETVNQIIFLAADFQRAGVEKQEMQNRIEEIVRKADSIVPELQLEKELKDTVTAQAETAGEILEHLSEE